MALIFNSNTISTSTGVVKYNGNNVTKVVYNGTTVWEKITKTPFYIVEGYVIKTAMVWRCTASNNTMASPGYIRTWTVGDSAAQTGNAQVNYGLKDDTKGGSWTFVSDAISAKGCTKVNVNANAWRYMETFTCNGKSYTTSGSTYVFDITGSSTLSFTISMRTDAYNQCYFQPMTMYVY